MEKLHGFQARRRSQSENTHRARIWKHCPRRVYPSAGQAFEVVFIDRLHFGWRRSDAAKLEPKQKHVEAWQRSELTDVTAKVVIYEAFVEGNLEAPKHLARTVHDLYFEPKYEEFRSRTIWSLSNAFYISIQGTGADPAVQGNCQVGRVPGIPRWFAYEAIQGEKVRRRCSGFVPALGRWRT